LGASLGLVSLALVGRRPKVAALSMEGESAKVEPVRIQEPPEAVAVASESAEADETSAALLALLVLLGAGFGVVVFRTLGFMDAPVWFAAFVLAAYLYDVTLKE